MARWTSGVRAIQHQIYQQLAKLPGIGEVYSQKIIDGRPYKSKAELESKHILPKGVYQKVAAQVIAHVIVHQK
jgi:radical SAM superfamily enzyme with C-terminal helix-hairpin-helix motif